MGNQTLKKTIMKEQKYKQSFPSTSTAAKRKAIMRYGEKPMKPYKIPPAGNSSGAGWGGEKPMKKKGR